MALNPPAGGWAPPVTRLLRELEMDVSTGVFQSYVGYLDQVSSWGARMDLTAARSADELVDLSFADAVVIARQELAAGAGSSQRWVDVGSGGGAPGLPLLTLLQEAQPDLQGFLIEPRGKRVAFLRSCVGTLGLGSLEVRRCRSEALAAKGYTRAVARATLPPEAWLAEGARLATEAVWVLVAREAPPSHPGWSLERDVSYCWPLTGAQRRALRYVPS